MVIKDRVLLVVFFAAVTIGQAGGLNTTQCLTPLLFNPAETAL